jgi:hypothetical protein
LCDQVTSLTPNTYKALATIQEENEGMMLQEDIVAEPFDRQPEPEMTTQRSPKNDYAGVSQPKKKSICIDKFICFTCEMNDVTSEDLINGDHLNHDVKHYDSALPLIISKRDEILDRIDKAINQSQDDLRVLDEKKQSVESEGRDLKLALQNGFKQLYKQLEAKESEMINALNNEIAERVEDMGARSTELANLLDELQEFEKVLRSTSLNNVENGQILLKNGADILAGLEEKCLSGAKYAANIRNGTLNLATVLEEMSHIESISKSIGQLMKGNRIQEQPNLTPQASKTPTMKENLELKRFDSRGPRHMLPQPLGKTSDNFTREETNHSLAWPRDKIAFSQKNTLRTLDGESSFKSTRFLDIGRAAMPEKSEAIAKLESYHSNTKSFKDFKSGKGAGFNWESSQKKSELGWSFLTAKTQPLVEKLSLQTAKANWTGSTMLGSSRTESSILKTLQLQKLKYSQARDSFFK